MLALWMLAAAASTGSTQSTALTSTGTIATRTFDVAAGGLYTATMATEIVIAMPLLAKLIFPARMLLLRLLPFVVGLPVLSILLRWRALLLLLRVVLLLTRQH